jgi:hypothetical protein
MSAWTRIDLRLAAKAQKYPVPSFRSKAETQTAIAIWPGSWASKKAGFVRTQKTSSGCTAKFL